MTDKKHEPSIQALVWYKEEDWDTLMELFPDSHLLPKTFSQWLVRAEQMIEKVQKDGDIAIKVFIDPVTFPAWCRERGKEPDMEARTQMAIEVATRHQFGDRT
ncbi:MAG: hypothetical protein ABFS19_01375 [Thermodesulfobacteriota bacterium]